jgi:hypothetical protein
VTYSYTTPDASIKDALRFLIQDTDPFDANEWQVTDEEIQYSYDTWFPLYDSLHYVAATIAETIAARYAREASYSADGVSISLGPVGDQYRVLAASLREQDRATKVGTLVDAGGISPNEPMEPNTKPFSFGKGIHDFVEAGPQEFGGIYPPDQDVGNWGIPDYEKIVEP